VIRKSIVTTLAVHLTPAEVADRAARAVHALSDLEDLENDYFAYRKEQRREIKVLRAKLKALAVAAHTKRERQEGVTCEVVMDPVSMKKWFEYRGEKYEITACTEQEVQEKIQPSLFPEQSQTKDEDIDDDTTYEDQVEDIVAGIYAVSQ